MKAAQAQAALAALPSQTLAQAYARVTGSTGTASRSTIIQALAVEVAAGRLTLDQISGMKPVAPQATGPATAPAVQAHVLAGLLGEISRLETLIQATQQAQVSEGTIDAKVAGALHQHQQAAQTLRATVATLEARLAQAEAEARAQAEAVAGAVSSLAPRASEVAEEVRRAAREALAPFVSRVVAEGRAEEVAQAVAGPVDRKTAREVFGVDVRGRDGSPLTFALWGHAEAPPVDPCHIWTEQTVRALYLAESTGRNIWLGGPAGTGKTQTAQQYAARTGRMFRRFVFTRYATGDDFLGATGMVNGSTVFQPGPVLEAYTTPGAVCLLDEPGMGNPAAMSVLNGLLEGAARIAYGDRVWLRGSGNLFIGADNSLGQGDPSGRFAGVQQQNTALMDRFAFLVPCTYLPPATEAAALMQHTGCSQALADHVVAAFGVARAKVETGDLIDPPTFRQALGFVQACKVLPVAEAWRVTVAARQPAESQVALAAIYSAAINESLIEGEV